MIVDPDFFDHWRTLMLTDALGGDELAPVYVMRVWAHCQSRRSDRFQMPAAGLKAICRYKGEAELLEKSMIEAGFVEREDDFLCVPKWMEHNASLVQRWTNGKRGGRPKKTEGKPNGNRGVTGEKPGNNRTETGEKPNGNRNTTPGSRNESEERGGEKRGGEESSMNPSGSCVVGSGEPKTPTEFTFPLGKPAGATWNLPQSKLDEYIEAFPHLDVPSQLRAARQWARDNAAQRKTSGGMPAFLTRWLNKAQNSGQGNARGQPGRGNPQKAKPPTDDDLATWSPTG